ncbi:hypothetical protein ACFOWE_30315 [Planomonospora corallina]|uniref:Uncharacterized protein n=1 Tax=Planomonospora corallina TaxID=1806052 RepID=A0ABV8IFF3_9ACTN
MSSLPIGRRLGAGFLVVVLNMVLLTAFGVMQVERINTGLTTINDLNSVKRRRCGCWRRPSRCSSTGSPRSTS